ncbi:Outer membrane protein assembly factor BamA [Fodinibius salinus]|uniref:Outer membrane protein assembly factor BamA n=1 Tax=Fodinibius salinus TaxID=860790 RepID=A0A5D3YMK4_9BACT|nr:BamA/TamA family outer membrane protein [Fodinibius salinus]TYP95140.1 Outer membrane protein assembly factor BamA [Fodinibius salinus]
MKDCAKTLQSILYLSAIILVALPAITIAQTNATENDTTDNVVRAIRFVGNDNVKDNTLETLIRTKTNREFLGIPRFTPWYFIFKLTGKFGERPALFNRSTTGNDIKRIKRYYKTVGYLDATVDTNVVEFKKDKIEVSFLIDEGNAYSIQSLSYSGLPDFKDTTKVSKFFKDSPLTKGRINDSTYAVNKQYSEKKLAKERNRIITFLRNNGHASVQRDSVKILIKHDSTDQFTLDGLFKINAGPKYTFGDLRISLAGPDDTLTYNQQDTVRKSSLTAGDNAIFLQKESSAQTKFSLLTDQILFKPGDTFDNSQYIRTVNEFQNLRMLTIQQFSLSEDGSLPDYSKEQIPVTFTLQTLPKHSINFNIFGMKRYGFGSGAGLTYTNNNLFGKAENLQLSVNGSFEYVSSNTIADIVPDSSTQSFNGRFFQNFESRLEYSLPRLTFPFRALDDNLNFLNGRTRYSLSFSRSNQLLFDINSDIRFNLRYEVDHNERFSSYLDLIELDLLDTDPSPQFRQSLREDFGENSFEYQRILEDFRPQVSSILRYTFRSQRTNLIKRNYGYFSEYSIALGGNLPYLGDRYIITPDTVEGNLPPIFPNSQNSLAYSRFVKGTADYREYIPISNNGVFAYRGFFGVAIPYGNSNSIPLNQRFYAGGSNDIRGWDIYSLGPGGIALDNVTINGGEIKLLAQTEVRQRFIRDFISANWIAAWFTDAGNIWYGPKTEFPSGQSQMNNIPNQSQREQLLERGKFHFDEFYKQIAVGSGLGIRLDWEYVVARFDFAFRIHDLQQGWFEDKKLYFSFGIGHSF